MRSAATGVRIAIAIPLGAAAVAAPGVGCGSEDEGTTEPGPAAAPTVEARDFAFEPSEQTVETGASVSWANTGETIHNVKGKGFFSDGLDPGETYERRFAKAGEYRYLCTLHPETMRGRISVR